MRLPCGSRSGYFCVFRMIVVLPTRSTETIFAFDHNLTVEQVRQIDHTVFAVDALDIAQHEIFRLDLVRIDHCKAHTGFLLSRSWM